MDTPSIVTAWSDADRLVDHVGMQSMSLLAHQGGWDEILLVAGPMALIVLLLAIVKRRIDAQVQQPAEDDGSRHDTSSDDVV